VVLKETVSGAGEIPDAIGWFCGGRFSILIECKAGLVDFRGDRRKRFRRSPERGMGAYRYYLAPPGAIGPDKLPKHWGLLEADGRCILVRRLADWQPRGEAEVKLLYSALRRLQERQK
jgi:hypothetical protein